MIPAVSRFSYRAPAMSQMVDGKSCNRWRWLQLDTSTDSTLLINADLNWRLSRGSVWSYKKMLGTNKWAVLELLRDLVLFPKAECCCMFVDRIIGKSDMTKRSRLKTKWTKQSPLFKWAVIINTCSAKQKPSGNSLPGTVWLFTARKPQAANTSMSYARAHSPHLREPIPACTLTLPSSYYWHCACRVNVKKKALKQNRK